MSVFFANKYPTAVIYAIEPELSNYDLLVKNTYGYKKIVPIQAAIWKDNSPVCIENLDAEKWAFKVTEKKNNETCFINSLTINDILEMANSNFVDILKIDIEGSEKELFEDNLEAWIDKIGIFIIELHECFRKGARSSFYKAISILKYQEYIQGENHFIIVN